jgi:hypothetical protein
MDEEVDILEIINNLVDTRGQFFSRCFNGIQHENRFNGLNMFLSSERLYIELLDRIHRSQTRQNLVANIITWTAEAPQVPPGFTSSVRVIASPEQIASSIESIPSSHSNCAICQDSITSGASRIRQCGHEYHESCLSSWFTMSVRCPVCRHDIREPNPNATGHTTQTFFGAV